MKQYGGDFTELHKYLWAMFYVKVGKGILLCAF